MPDRELTLIFPCPNLRLLVCLLLQSSHNRSITEPLDFSKTSRYKTPALKQVAKKESES